MQQLEHSVEALLPFIQYYNRNADIIPILVPSMNFERMDLIAKHLAESIYQLIKKYNYKLGTDIAIVISSDAVHYGDMDWGQSNYAFFGADSAGYKKALLHETEIINQCFLPKITIPQIKSFINFTVDKTDYKKYIWTWCGRYSVPFGLLSAYYLQEYLHKKFNGHYIGYSTSISHPQIPVNDINIGTTAPANIRHWVGYAAIGYK